MGVSGLDLSTLTSGLAVPYYNDFVLNASAISNGSVTVQVGPSSGVQSILPNAILNGFEVIKMSNYAGSLDGLFSVSGTQQNTLSGSRTMKIAEAFGLAMGIAAILLLVIAIIRWHRRPQGWEKQAASHHGFFLSIPATAVSCLARSRANLNAKLDTLIHLGRQFCVHNNCDPVVVTAVALPFLYKPSLHPPFHDKLRP
ncbi:hypothetical protein RJ639_000777 [Escallonia herrerae]|uniref:Uncharacterized protein n=1 Tax=Escallonia herrerae TaxID=1293975 RepID=A0AA89BGA1_9ASTE|nr:hypothetical protein RJ639_000777 [Escallonia herrerae]